MEVYSEGDGVPSLPTKKLTVADSCTNLPSLALLDELMQRHKIEFGAIPWCYASYPQNPPWFTVLDSSEISMLMHNECKQVHFFTVQRLRNLFAKQIGLPLITRPEESPGYRISKADEWKLPNLDERKVSVGAIPILETMPPAQRDALLVWQEIATRLEGQIWQDEFDRHHDKPLADYVTRLPRYNPGIDIAMRNAALHLSNTINHRHSLPLRPPFDYDMSRPYAPWQLRSDDETPLHTFPHAIWSDELKIENSAIRSA